LNGFDDSHLEDVEKIVGKEMHNAYQSVCALTSESEGNLYCWGYNGYGQLGVGDTSSRSKATNVPGFGLLSVKDVFVGGHSSGGFSCAIVGDSREVYCWGYNGYGQLGVGDKVKKTVPQKVAGLSDVNSLELSHSDYGTSCAIVGDSREVYCWGYNGYGQLGVGDKVAKTVPQKIEGINNVLKLNSIGSGTTTSYCALKTDGSLYCWGYNGYGRLGVGDNLYKTIPTAVADLNNVKDIDGYGYGTYGHYCAIVGDSREVYCWGYNGYGQLGQGSSGNSYYNSPQKVLGLDGKIVENISCGGYHAGNICSAILSDKTMRVWGYNGYGNLGTGDTLNKYTATAPE